MLSRNFIIILFVCTVIILNLIALQQLNLTGSYVSKLPVQKDVMTVSEVFQKAIINESVVVRGTVNRVLPEYTSKKGYKYQQFYITDGSKEIKIFCSERYGKIDVKVGDKIIASGKYQKFYKEMEIYGYCSEIKII